MPTLVTTLTLHRYRPPRRVGMWRFLHFNPSCHAAISSSASVAWFERSEIRGLRGAQRPRISLRSMRATCPSKNSKPQDGFARALSVLKGCARQARRGCPARRPGATGWREGRACPVMTVRITAIHVLLQGAIGKPGLSASRDAAVTCVSRISPALNASDVSKSSPLSEQSNLRRSGRASE